MVELNDFDDVKLDRVEANVAPPAARPVWLPLLIAVLLVGSAFWFFLLRKSPPNDVTVRTDLARVETPKPPPRSAAEPGYDIAVPALAETDALVRRLVAQMSSHPRVAAWLTTNQLIRNFTTVVVNIADGQTPMKSLPEDG